MAVGASAAPAPEVSHEEWGWELRAPKSATRMGGGGSGPRSRLRGLGVGGLWGPEVSHEDWGWELWPPVVGYEDWGGRGLWAPAPAPTANRQF